MNASTCTNKKIIGGHSKEQNVCRACSCLRMPSGSFLAQFNGQAMIRQIKPMIRQIKPLIRQIKPMIRQITMIRQRKTVIWRVKTLVRQIKPDDSTRKKLWSSKQNATFRQRQTVSVKATHWSVGFFCFGCYDFVSIDQRGWDLLDTHGCYDFVRIDPGGWDLLDIMDVMTLYALPRGGGIF